MNFNYSKVKTADFAPRATDETKALTIERPDGEKMKVRVLRNGNMADERLGKTEKEFRATMEKHGFKIINEERV